MSMFYIVALVLIVFFLASAIRVLREYERAVIFRLGRVIKTKGSDLNGAYFNRNVGWVSVFCVTHQALRSNTTHFLMSAYRHKRWVTAQTACLTHPTSIMESPK